MNIETLQNAHCGDFIRVHNLYTGYMRICAVFFDSSAAVYLFDARPYGSSYPDGILYKNIPAEAVAEFRRAPDNWAD